MDLIRRPQVSASRLKAPGTMVIVTAERPQPRRFRIAMNSPYNATRLKIFPLLRDRCSAESVMALFRSPEGCDTEWYAPFSPVPGSLCGRMRRPTVDAAGDASLMSATHPETTWILTDNQGILADRKMALLALRGCNCSERRCSRAQTSGSTGVTLDGCDHSRAL